MPSSFAPVRCYSCDRDVAYDDYHDTHRQYCEHCDQYFCAHSYDYCPDCDGADPDYCNCPDCDGADPDYCNCPDCRENRNEGGPDYEGIYPWNYTPDLQFHGEGDYHLGMELEISTSGQSAHPIYNWAIANNHEDLFYVKEDSSVSGFEIVTHPMTPDYFESVNWESFFDMLNREFPFRSPRLAGETEREGHGLHVHVSRTAFPSMTALARWSYLLNRSGREHMQRIARRVSDQWAAFRDTPVSDVMSMHAPGPTYWLWASVRRHDFRDSPVMCACGCGETYYDRLFVQPQRPNWRHRMQTRPERYNAVNLLNPNTVEVRLFRSTRSADEFMDSVRTLYASVEYVRTMQPHHMTTVATSAVMAWEGFAEYVSREYAALYPTVAGMAVGQPDPSLMSEALAADTALTGAEWWSGCDVPGCTVRHRDTTPIDRRRHEDSNGFAIAGPSTVPSCGVADCQECPLIPVEPPLWTLDIPDLHSL